MWARSRGGSGSLSRPTTVGGGNIAAWGWDQAKRLKDLERERAAEEARGEPGTLSGEPAGEAAGGRAAFQARGRRFESRRPLHSPSRRPLLAQLHDHLDLYGDPHRQRAHPDRRPRVAPLLSKQLHQ